MLCILVVLRCHSCLGYVTYNDKCLVNTYFIFKIVIDSCQLSLLSCADFVRKYVAILTDNYCKIRVT